MSSLIFWDVDTQIDFMHPEGKLYVPGAEQIIPNVQHLNTFAAESGIPIVSSTDAHLQSDPEFSQYPPHCLVGTTGQQKVSDTLLPRRYIVPNRKVELPEDIGSYQQIIIEKQDVDVFTNPNIDALLAMLGKQEIILYGVVTEICVDRAARGLIKRGYRVHLVADAVQHVDSDAGRSTLEFVRRHGGRIVTAGEIFAGRPQTAASSSLSIPSLLKS